MVASNQRKKLKSPGSRHSVTRTGPAGEEAATLQVVVEDEIMCVIYRAEQGEVRKTLIYKICLKAKMFGLFSRNICQLPFLSRLGH